MVAHPKVFSQRRLKLKEDVYLNLPVLDRADLEEKGVRFDLREQASTLADDLILIAGQVERVTEFEKGIVKLEAYLDGAWVPDPFWDDQAIAIKVKDKGLVVMGGCSHAGIINTVKHFCKVSQTEIVHAVLGGFHLTGADSELINTTVENMKEIDPEYIVPMHCTGWNAINIFATQMPEEFILNSAGTTYIF
jgi:7,8-dihydropterin-6-yl-methyl-4-(beta-D-ribofuranosyl)aminobenzene 5'-phosphate synthase